MGDKAWADLVTKDKAGRKGFESSPKSPKEPTDKFVHWHDEQTWWRRRGYLAVCSKEGSKVGLSESGGCTSRPAQLGGHLRGSQDIFQSSLFLLVPRPPSLKKAWLQTPQLSVGPVPNYVGKSKADGQGNETPRRQRCWTACHIIELHLQVSCLTPGRNIVDSMRSPTVPAEWGTAPWDHRDSPSDRQKVALVCVVPACGCHDVHQELLPSCHCSQPKSLVLSTRSALILLPRVLLPLHVLLPSSWS